MNSPISVITDDKAAQVSKVYTIDQSNNEKMILTVYPIADTYNTEFEFEYFVTGTPLEEYQKAYFDLFKGEIYGDQKRIMAVSGAGLIILLVICCICACFRNCCKKNKVGVDGAEETRSLKLNANGDSMTEGNGGDLELESIHGDEGNDTANDVNESSGNPQVKKLSKEQRQEQLKNAYTNPFKLNPKNNPAMKPTTQAYPKNDGNF